MIIFVWVDNKTYNVQLHQRKVCLYFFSCFFLCLNICVRNKCNFQVHTVVHGVQSKTVHFGGQIVSWNEHVSEMSMRANTLATRDTILLQTSHSESDKPPLLAIFLSFSSE